MIICVSYNIGESSEYKYFDTYEQMLDFIKQLVNVNNSEFCYFNISVNTGEEETRIRKIIEKE